MQLIDTHAHLYSEEFDGQTDAMMQRAFAEGITKIYMPAIDSQTTLQMLRLENQYPANCTAMMGLHPCYVKQNWAAELKLVEQWLGKRKFAAIGEIGLDFYWDTSFLEEQYHCFKTQITWALQYNLPIVIHSRNATEQTIAVINQYANQGLRGIFHCFGGSIAEAKAIVAAGFYLGIGGVVTYKKSGLDEVLKQIPLEHIVLETDAPYLAPVPHRGKQNESSYLIHIVAKLAAVYHLTPQQIAAATTANAKKIFEG